jgi:hypothetical protein
METNAEVGAEKGWPKSLPQEQFVWVSLVHVLQTEIHFFRRAIYPPGPVLMLSAARRKEEKRRKEEEKRNS